MPHSKRDRTTGLPVPSPVVPLTDICYRIRIPNALEYRSAFKGALSELGKTYNWEQTTGDENDNAFQAAMLWRERIQEAEYLIDCEGKMSCGDIAECIETSPDVAEALAALIASNEALQNALISVGGGTQFAGGSTYPGVGLTPSQMSERLNEIDECAFDPYWAQVDQFIDYLLDLGQDTLDKLALYTTALAAGTATGKMAGLIQKLKNGTTAGKVTEFLNWAAGTMKTAYEAADDTGNRNAIKCALFCQNRDSCLITLDGLGATLNERLGGILDPSSITSLTGLAETIVAITFDPSLALDLWLTFLLGTAKTAGILGLEGIDETIQLMLKVAVNDANNDWETLCEDCPAVEDPIALQPFGFSGLQFGTMPSIVDSGEPFVAESTEGPSGSSDAIICFYVDVSCTIHINSSTWSFVSVNPSAALYGYCPVGLDPTNFANYTIVRESSGQTSIPIPWDAGINGVFFESAGGPFELNITLTKI